VRALIAAGIRVTVAGDYWQRFPDLRNYCAGHLSAAELGAWTRRTQVALCLVRRANRDGHVMRSFEIPAIGACMVAEETAEHRRIFGEDGAAVRYFRSAAELVAVVKELLQSRDERARLRLAARDLITGGPNTYADRLRTLETPCKVAQ
jgi:spore maturation protein CgeB